MAQWDQAAEWAAEYPRVAKLGKGAQPLYTSHISLRPVNFLINILKVRFKGNKQEIIDNKLS